MRIAIEAQRIFRKDKHGMDFVILETLKELQSGKTVMNITYSLLRGGLVPGRIGKPPYH